MSKVRIRLILFLLTTFASMTQLNEILLNQSDARLKRLVDFIFLAWILTLPFGSNLMRISIGFLTIYPNLLFTFFLLPVALLTFKKWGKLELLSSCFLFVWILFGIFMARNSSYSKESVFDIRSLVMQFFFAIVLISSYHFIGKEQFTKNVIRGLRCFLFILLTAGILEFLTGIHFYGTKTNELLSLPVGNIFYAPLFIYDNPNDYLSYLIFVFLMLIIFDEQLKSSRLLQLFISLILLLFSFYADSTFAKMIAFGLISFQLILALFSNLKSSNKSSFFIYFISIILFLITILNNQLFLGPKYENSANYRLNGVQIIIENKGQIQVISAKEKLSEPKQAQVIRYLDSVNTKSPEGSTNLRKNLILVGLDFIKSAPVFGIGPGGFALKIKQNEHKKFVHTHTSPHNLPIEIISQFGIFGWIYFGLIAFICLKICLLQKRLKTNDKISFLFLLFALPLLWMMPSAYLYLSIHWLFLPLLLIKLLLIQEKTNLDERKQ